MRSTEEIRAQLEKMQQARRIDPAARGWCEALEWLDIDTEEAPELSLLPPTLAQDAEKQRRYLSQKSLLEQARLKLPDRPLIRVADWLRERPGLDPSALLAECDRYALCGCIYNIPMPELYRRWFCDTWSLETYPVAARYVLDGRWEDVLIEFVQRLGIREPLLALSAKRLGELREEAAKHNERARQQVLRAAEEAGKEAGKEYHF